MTPVKLVDLYYSPPMLLTRAHCSSRESFIRSIFVECKAVPKGKAPNIRWHFVRPVARAARVQRQVENFNFEQTRKDSLLLGITSRTESISYEQPIVIKKVLPESIVKDRKGLCRVSHFQGSVRVDELVAQFLRRGPRNT